jgi:lysyl-tRNA synthetase class 2
VTGSRPLLGQPATLSPCDLDEACSGRAWRVGGRIAQVEGQSAVVADALVAIGVCFESVVRVLPGDLVVVQGVFREGRVVGASLVERWPARVPTAAAEFARLSWQGVGARLRQRAEAFRLIRKYFEQQRFVEVDTPVRVRAPNLDRNVDPVRAGRDWLITSPEYAMKQLLVGGMPRIYQLVHCHRARELGPLHEPEFMMLEWYRAFSELEVVLGDTEQIVSSVLGRLTGTTSVRLPDGTRVDFRPPFVKMTIREAFRQYAGIDDAVALAARDEQRYFEVLVERVEPQLSRHPRPVFLHDYPLTQAALARHNDHDPTTAARFELYVGGVELCNGYGELTDPTENLRRMRSDRAWRLRERRARYPVDARLMAALSEGMPPSAGNALGVDRLVAVGCQVASIAEVVAIPNCRE